ncbi:hypothetical protein [Mycobacteroides abscessus]|uniref:hypothetical protein n=1 Tax=Mycobacteroides abscessus TaxID=36809 RepID=UPI00030D6CDF|nr:hypothetical protein [Mycobacteroides abscessus]MBL3752560.1 hypothetical protein [Mycobacteroides abscessus subsp. massiliense]MBN7318961.1 hypothetical protein [Mycobacteroides abscessus subsp. massiliense]MBN7428026.1 hypothetical protein [Mycobacteroides abscessus subsp. massiliense]MBN7465041.1 hypothetical protein [Mycobacteroides abscessus subsp. massiliense]MBN7512333.1 hypothetical protein [Mycobacteroides abscessus subsp. massiliense]
MSAAPVLPGRWRCLDDVELTASSGFGDELAAEISDADFDTGFHFESGVLLAFA